MSQRWDTKKLWVNPNIDLTHITLKHKFCIQRKWCLDSLCLFSLRWQLVLTCRATRSVFCFCCFDTRPLFWRVSPFCLFKVLGLFWVTAPVGSGFARSFKLFGIATQLRSAAHQMSVSVNSLTESHQLLTSWKAFHKLLFTQRNAKEFKVSSLSWNISNKRKPLDCRQSPNAGEKKTVVCLSGMVTKLLFNRWAT